MILFESLNVQCNHSGLSSVGSFQSKQGRSQCSKDIHSGLRSAVTVLIYSCCCHRNDMLTMTAMVLTEEGVIWTSGKDGF